MVTFRFRAVYARRIPDPRFEGIRRYVFVLAIRDLPEGIPDEPNARTQNTRTQVAKKVKESLLDIDCERGTFHLKNGGITILADSVKRNSEDHDLFTLTFDEHQGIVDGGHTYRIIMNSLSDPNLPEDQFVNIDVFTGVHSDWIPEISGGRNTSVQVQPMSLDNLKGKFEWLKQEFESMGHTEAVAWSENDDGEFNARDVVAWLTLFLVQHFPNQGGSHPLVAYSSKAKALDLFESNPADYEILRPILKDIVRLFDEVRFGYYELWIGQGGKPGKLSVSDKKKRGHWNFRFIEQSSQYRLSTAALYPILAAFRWFVEIDESEDRPSASWRGGFNRVLEAWDACAVDMLSAVNETSRRYGYRLTAVGKDSNLWSLLHMTISNWDLMQDRLRRDS